MAGPIGGRGFVFETFPLLRISWQPHLTAAVPPPYGAAQAYWASVHQVIGGQASPPPPLPDYISAISYWNNLHKVG